MLRIANFFDFIARLGRDDLFFFFFGNVVNENEQGIIFV